MSSLLGFDNGLFYQLRFPNNGWSNQLTGHSMIDDSIKSGVSKNDLFIGNSGVLAQAISLALLITVLSLPLIAIVQGY